MCKFKSGIVLCDEREKGGFKLLMSPWTESHSELCTLFKLNDGKMLHFARVEFSPDVMENAHLVEKYKLSIDEERTPEWLDDEMKSAVSAKMSDYIKRIIVSGEVELLVGGQFIIAPGAFVRSSNHCAISIMCGGTLNEMWGGTLNAMRGGTLNAMRGGTLNVMCGGTLNVMCGGTLNEMSGGTLNAMWGGTLKEMWGGTLNAMRGGTLNVMCGGTLNEMSGGTLNEMCGGTLNEMCGGTLVKDKRSKKAVGEV